MANTHTHIHTHMQWHMQWQTHTHSVPRDAHSGCSLEQGSDAIFAYVGLARLLI